MAAATELWLYWPARRMLLHEGRHWLEGFPELHASMPGEPAPALRAWALKAAGNMAREQGDYMRATACYEEALELAQTVGQRLLIASLLNNPGNITLGQADFARAEALYRASLALREEFACRLDAARAAERTGDLDAGEWEALRNELGPGEMPDSAERAVVLAHLAESNAQATATTIYNMAQLAMVQGDLGQATVQCEQACKLFAEGGWASTETQARSLLGEIMAHLGDQEQACALLEQVVHRFRAEEANWDLAEALNRLGWAARVQGEAARAVALHQEGLALSHEIGDQRGLAQGLEWLGMAEAAMGRSEVATRLLGAGAALRQALNLLLFPVYRATFERVTTDLRERLGEERFAALWEVGGNTPVAQLLVTDDR